MSNSTQSQWKHRGGLHDAPYVLLFRPFRLMESNREIQSVANLTVTNGLLLSCCPCSVEERAARSWKRVEEPEGDGGYNPDGPEI